MTFLYPFQNHLGNPGAVGQIAPGPVELADSNTGIEHARNSLETRSSQVVQPIALAW